MNGNFLILGRNHKRGGRPEMLDTWAPDLAQKLAKLASITMSGTDEPSSDFFRAIAIRDIDPRTKGVQTSLFVERYMDVASPDGLARLSGRCAMHFVTREGFGMALAELVVCESPGDRRGTLRVEDIDGQLALGMITMDALSPADLNR